MFRKFLFGCSLLVLLVQVSCKEDQSDQKSENELEPKTASTTDILKEGWQEFQENGNRTKIEILNISDSLFVNQKIIFDNKDQIDSINSKFFTIKVPDTLTQGPNKGIAELYTFNKPFESRASSVIIENKYPDGSIVKDTFFGNPENLEFGIYASEGGDKQIKGEISEILLAKDEEGNGYKIKVTSFFTEHVYVKE
ncbi:hypothetical protein HC174_03900 [Salinimicrobium sp. CDJ15-81-2]|nr:hypothetical protein [Salinimicrobium nanhaiense]